MTLIKVLLQLSTVARVSAGPARRCFAHLSISTRVSAVSASATFWSMRIRSYAAGKGRSDPRSSPEGPSEADDIFKILPEIYDTAMASFGPIWSDLVATVVDIYRDSEGPSNVLDLASGPGEPGTMLAEQFPMAMVTMSDLEDKMLEQARRRVEERLSSERAKTVAIRKIDILKLQEDASIRKNSLDLVTCSLGLFLAPDGIGDIYKILKPGGYLVAAVWDSTPAADITGRCIAKINGLEEIPPVPVDGTSLGNGKADSMLRAAGFRESKGHNQVGILPLNIGPIGHKKTFILGALPYLSNLLKEDEKNPGSFQETQEEFWEESRRFLNLGETDLDLVYEYKYRILCVQKPYN